MGCLWVSMFPAIQSLRKVLLFGEKKVGEAAEGELSALPWEGTCVFVGLLWLFSGCFNKCSASVSRLSITIRLFYY